LEKLLAVDKLDDEDRYIDIDELDEDELEEDKDIDESMIPEDLL
jgi:hypothetical protein